MSWTPYRTGTFLGTARKFFLHQPEMKPEFGDLLRQLEGDPFAPRLRLHALKGRRRGRHAVSLTYSFRVVLTLQIQGRQVVLLDIGTHDEVTR
jgi:mRNA-degrading endonuclease YafQ of YafQ-DinJ toxin-antitoxin module